MTFVRSFKHWRFAVAATTVFAAVAGAMAIWYSVYPLDRWAHIALAGLSLVSAVLAVVAFRGRRGHFVVDGNSCVWDTTFFKYRQHMLDLAEVTTIAYEQPDSASQRLVARLRNGTSVRLPPLYLFRSRDIAEFLDFLGRTHADIKIVGRDLLPVANKLRQATAAAPAGGD